MESQVKSCLSREVVTEYEAKFKTNNSIDSTICEVKYAHFNINDNQMYLKFDVIETHPYMNTNVIKVYRVII